MPPERKKQAAAWRWSRSLAAFGVGALGAVAAWVAIEEWVRRPEIQLAWHQELGDQTRANNGVLITTSTFTPAASSFILTEPNLDGEDFDGVVAWLQEYTRDRALRP